MNKIKVREIVTDKETRVVLQLIEGSLMGGKYPFHKNEENPCCESSLCSEGAQDNFRHSNYIEKTFKNKKEAKNWETKILEKLKKGQLMYRKEKQKI